MSKKELENPKRFYLFMILLTIVLFIYTQFLSSLTDFSAPWKTSLFNLGITVILGAIVLFLIYLFRKRTGIDRIRILRNITLALCTILIITSTLSNLSSAFVYIIGAIGLLFNGILSKNQSNKKSDYVLSFIGAGCFLLISLTEFYFDFLV